MSLHYSEIKLYHYNYDLSRNWYLEFTVTENISRKKMRKQVRGYINTYNTKPQRLKEAKALIETWQEQFKEGYNPFVPEETNELLTMDFKAAIEFALSKCVLAKKSMQGYRSTARFIIAAAEAAKLHTKPIVEVKRMHIKMILEKGKEQFGWTNASYNKHLNYLQGIIKRLVDWEIIENNPAHKIGNLPVAETEKYIPYTEAEKRAIQEYLQEHHYRFYVFLIFLYSTGVRPKEILALRIKDIDLINQQITILPDIITENSKTKKIRKVPINNHLLELLKTLQLNEYPKNYFLFGSRNEVGKGNAGSAVGKLTGANHPDFFKPSLVHIKRDTVTKLWKKIVIDQLGIKKHLYAGKKTGANAMILAGVALDSLKDLYGHTSVLTTEIYATEVKRMRFNEVIDKSPKF